MALFGSKTSKTEDKKDKPADKKAAVNATSKEATEKEATSMKDLYSEAPVKSVSGAKSKTASAAKFTASNRLLVRPLVTEKATIMAADSKYSFVVAKEANKIEVAKAVKAVYGVNPVDVNIINMKGKRVTRGRIRGQRKDWKKAIVTLSKGETIALYEGV